MRKKTFRHILLTLLTLLGISWTGKQMYQKNQARPLKKNIWGEWTLFLEQSHIKKHLKISQDGELFIDFRKIEGITLSSSKHSFVFRDHFGYRMELFQDATGAATFYDEADDKEYRAERH